MKHKFVIHGRLDALNEYTSANRRNYHVGGNMKRDNEKLVIAEARSQLGRLQILNPVVIHYTFFEKDHRRDNDNILSCASKFIQDSLVKIKVLQNDNQKCIHRFWFDTYVDSSNPRIEVTIYEISKEQLKMSTAEIIRMLKVGE